MQLGVLVVGSNSQALGYKRSFVDLVDSVFVVTC